MQPTTSRHKVTVPDGPHRSSRVPSPLWKTILNGITQAVSSGAHELCISELQSLHCSQRGRYNLPCHTGSAATPTSAPEKPMQRPSNPRIFHKPARHHLMVLPELMILLELLKQQPVVHYLHSADETGIPPSANAQPHNYVPSPEAIAARQQEPP